MEITPITADSGDGASIPKCDYSRTAQSDFADGEAAEDAEDADAGGGCWCHPALDERVKCRY